jgi:hypothetical protein
MNFVFLLIFFGISYRSYKSNNAVFINNYLGKLYVSGIFMSLVGLYFFSQRHIKNLYLLDNGKEIIIETYRNFGFSTGKEIKLDITQLKGNRTFLNEKLKTY